MENYEVLVIGGSAGSIQVLKTILKNIRRPLNIPIIVGMHRMAHDSTSNLVKVIQYSTPMPVLEPHNGQVLLPNHVYIAPADYHLVVETNQTASLSRTPLVHYSRPSIDVLFMSISEVFKAKAIGVLVTGANKDGATGLKMIKQQGGIAIIQDPADCFIDTMTQEALKVTSVDYILKANEITEVVEQLLH